MISGTNNHVIYLNCTAVAPHIGCMAVTDFHLHSLVSAGYAISDIVYCNFPWGSLWLGDREQSISSCLESNLGIRMAAADVVVMNGEGTLHHAPGVGLLIAAATARRLGKPVHITNTSIFAVDGFNDVLTDLTDLNVRESESSEYLRARNIPHRVVLDSFLGARFLEQPDRDLSGKTVVMDWHPGRDKDVGRATIKYYSKLSPDSAYFFPLNHYSHVKTWRHTVANLAAADVIVTGRYHGVYLAGLAGTPFVALPSNTRKIQGLIQASGLPLPICEDCAGVDAAVKRARQNPAIFHEFKAFLLEQLPLETFKNLLMSNPSGFTPDAVHASNAYDALESKVEAARLEEQHRSLFIQSRNRAESTPYKELTQIGRKAYLRLKRIARL